MACLGTRGGVLVGIFGIISIMRAFRSFLLALLVRTLVHHIRRSPRLVLVTVTGAC